MNPEHKRLVDELRAKQQALQTLLDRSDLTADEMTQAKTLDTECEALVGQIEQYKATNDLRSASAKRTAYLDVPVNAPVVPVVTRQDATAFGVHGAASKREKPRFLKTPQAFENNEDGAARAERFGHWFNGLRGVPQSLRFCKDHGVDLGPADLTEFRAMGGATMGAGGALVPTEFMPDLIRLVLEYGKFRQNARIVPMATDTKLVPRRTAGLSVYYVGENTTITDSDVAFDNVQLTARKMATLTKIASELDEDSAVDVGDTVAFEIAYAFAKAEDDAAFSGTGLSATGGMIGIPSKLLAVDGTIGNIKGLVVGAGNTYSELTRANFEAVVGALPDYADNDNTKWFMNRYLYYSIVTTLIYAAGGVTKEEIVNGQRTPMLYGYPVVFVNSMPKAEANSQIVALLGDIRLCGMLGDRRMMQIALSEHVNFAADQLTIRGTQRLDINIHDVGDTTNAGPIVGLITAAS